MSLLALLESRIQIWRLPDGSTGVNRLGEPSKVPVLSQENIRGSIDSPRYLFSQDQGAGDRATGHMILTVEARADIMLGDIIGVDVDTDPSWWTAHGVFRSVQRSSHIEGYVIPYVGVIPS